MLVTATYMPLLLDPAAQRHGGLGEMSTGSNHHGKDIAQIVARSDFPATTRRPEAVMSGFVARYFTDAEVRPPKFLHGIEPSQVCPRHPRKRESRAGGTRCEPNPQRAPRMCRDVTAEHPKIYYGILGCSSKQALRADKLYQLTQNLC